MPTVVLAFGIVTEQKNGTFPLIIQNTKLDQNFQHLWCIEDLALKMVELMERMNSMFEQESSFYRTVDYLDPEYQQMLSSVCDASYIDETMKSNDSLCSTASGINDVWREKICEWSYQVIDHFDFSREVVSVSIHYLDRFLATRPCNKKVFQLAAMTALFLAIKLYEPGKLSMQSMVELSRGYFKVEQMVAMEISVLRSLSWRVHPPTAYCFGKHLLYLLPNAEVTMDERHAILELARFLTELSVIDYYFVVKKPSTVALAALLNAIEDSACGADCANIFSIEVNKSTPIDPSSDDVWNCRNRLRQLYAQGGYANQSTQSTESRNDSISPVCVSFGVTTGQDMTSYAEF